MTAASSSHPGVVGAPVPNGEEPPVGWEVTSLGEIVKPIKEKIEPQEWPRAPYLSLEHVESHNMRIVGRGTASDVKSTKTVFRSGDVLYGKLRPYLNKVCIPNFDGICSTDFLVFPRSAAISSQLLGWFLSQPDVVQYANHHSSGVQLPRVKFETLAKLEVRLPPLAEQMRIMAKVEELLTRVNAARDHLDRVPAILKRFRQAVLAAACSGRLTADWRKDHPDLDPATILLERIRAGNHAKPHSRKFRKRRKAHPKESKGQHRFTTSVWSETPEKWCEILLMDVCSIQGGYAFKSDDYKKSGVPLIRIGNLVDGVVELGAGTQYLPVSYADQFCEYILGQGDWLIALSGATTGKIAVFDLAEKALLNQRVGRFMWLPDQLVCKEYFTLVLLLMTQQVLLEAYGGAQPNISPSSLGRLPCLLPPLAEQHEIVRRVERLFVLADTIEKRVAAAQARAEKLTQAVLAKAFRGELVPTEAELARQEGRDYESAAVLLERILAERSAREAHFPTRRKVSRKKTTRGKVKKK